MNAKNIRQQSVLRPSSRCPNRPMLRPETSIINGSPSIISVMSWAVAGTSMKPYPLNPLCGTKLSGM
ncbi:MAG: hypothetical protein GX991_03480 [Clostridiaceae bacterium]|nr:hypothetical protein [Clostridiaceae bacterium]